MTNKKTKGSRKPYWVWGKSYNPVHVQMLTFVIIVSLNYNAQHANIVNRQRTSASVMLLLNMSGKPNPVFRRRSDLRDVCVPFNAKHVWQVLVITFTTEGLKNWRSSFEV